MPQSSRISVAPKSVSKVEPKATSLKVVADHLGLSVAAVSRVLSGAPAARSIPKTTQDRIVAAAEMLNYRPNLFARSLRNRRSQTVGVIVPEVSEGYATLVLSGIEDALMQADYFYFLISHHHREEMIARSEQLFRDRAVEGVIAVDTLLRDRWAIPTVSVSGHHEPKGVTNIVLNHRVAAELAINHLSELGHRRVAFIKGQRFSSDTESRWRGIRHAMEKSGLTIFRGWSRNLRESSRRMSRGILRRSGCWRRERPLLRCLRSMMCRLLVRSKRCERLGCACRRTFRWWGFDDVQSAAFQNPGLTTVRQPLRTMGMLAAQAVLQQIGATESTVHTQQIVVDPELVVRESTCPASAVKR